jgi:hypothetical protein
MSNTDQPRIQTEYINEDQGYRAPEWGHFDGDMTNNAMKARQKGPSRRAFDQIPSWILLEERSGDCQRTRQREFRTDPSCVVG